MSFKEQIQNDISGVFLNTQEFADMRTVTYDGASYTIPTVISGTKEKDRVSKNHAEGLFLVSAVLHCSQSALGGNQPEKGTKIRITESNGSLRDYYVAESKSVDGMLRVELEGLDE